MKRIIGLSLENDLVDEIDRIRRLVPRSAYIEHTIKQSMGGKRD